MKAQDKSEKKSTAKRRLRVDGGEGMKVGVEKKEVVLPQKIEIKNPPKGVIPGHVFRQPAFKFSPITFATESERLNDKFVESGVQKNSLLMFLENPTLRMIYGVSGNPDDSKAKYFAGYLVNHHCKTVKSHSVVWHSLYGGFSNQLLDKAQDGSIKPTMLVLTNLTPNSTAVKLEKARDLIEFFNDIPRIIVCAGEDPLSFLTTRLYVPVNGLAYFSEPLVKQKIEVI